MKFWLYLQQRELAVLRTESEKWVCRFFGFSPGSRSASVGLNRTKTESETEPFSVGFSSNPIKWSVFRRVRCACVGIIRPLIVWCQMTLLQYLPLLRHTVQAGTSYPSGKYVGRAYILQQTKTTDTAVICYNKDTLWDCEGTTYLQAAYS